MKKGALRRAFFCCITKSRHSGGFCVGLPMSRKQIKISAKCSCVKGPLVQRELPVQLAKQVTCLPQGELAMLTEGLFFCV